MALDESAVSDLLDALRVGEGTDLVRELAQWALQQLIEVEAAAKIGADPWERSPERVTHRNGHRPRVLSTKAGDLELGIPKLRKGSSFPRAPRAPPGASTRPTLRRGTSFCSSTSETVASPNQCSSF